MKTPKTLKGYISILKMMESVAICDLKYGGASKQLVSNVVGIQADISNQIEDIIPPTTCQADTDGDCEHPLCPQKVKYETGCKLFNWNEY